MSQHIITHHCCSVLQCVAVCCSVLQCVATDVAAHKIAHHWQHAAALPATHCNILQHTEAHCSTLQLTTY